VLFVWKTRSGRRWARVVLTVLAVFSVLSNVLSLLQGGSTVVSAVVSLLLVPAAAVLMWRPAAKSYFAER